MPTTSVRTVDDRPALAFKSAPEGSIVFVDGLNMGAANEFDGDPKALTVEPGTHTVRITVNNTVIYEQRVFVESALKTITVR
jgi:archaellum component FlaG (FlaF/FlaG flagellin family)